MGTQVYGYNLGLGMVDAYTNFFDLQTKNLNGYINDLHKANIETKILSDVVNKLAHAKQKDKKVDFNSDETMKRYIVHIHKNNPTIFDGYIHGFPDHIPDEQKDDDVEGQISLEELLERSLRNIDLSKISFDVLNEQQIDVVTQGIDGQLKMRSADLNQYLMHINNLYDERSQMTEAARRVIDQARDLIKSINDRMTRH